MPFKQPSASNFVKGGSEKKWVPEGLIRVPAIDICLGAAYYVSCQKKTS